MLMQRDEAMSNPSRNEQRELWNGSAGQVWVESQALLDQMLRPIGEHLVTRVLDHSPGHVLDVGCGTGGTTVAVATALAEDGRCVGVDVSEAMVRAARRRALNAGVAADFVHACAQSHPFESNLADVVMSRFGVMFFRDFVAAFSNLRRSARPGARLHVVTWRHPDENPFMTAAERAAVSMLPELPPRVPGAPGQFGLADADGIRRMLVDAGWSDIEIDPLDASCSFPEAELDRYLATMGPVGRALQGVDDARRRQVVEAIRPAFEPFVEREDVRFEAACWSISARNPGG